ncbi:heterokaryon incompatibility protein-domain-containing protein [Corynascus novoguineensis]|uniref:Heterokaryon incompatibility protein-domain-containing protein n=1 Tax=Corynascus novoguineensis TaxID=1126955 RepID=A0AAN7CLG2_9PEZI|nr:heterokaryon incompatibility protein-domain-containing protein [Corynascus novoguineensis]
MGPYPYSPLDLGRPSIRLLRIQQEEWFDDIICQLFEACGDEEEGVPYKALSYTWGGSQHRPVEGLPRVLVDGHEIGLTQNLYIALRQIRPRNRDLILWVDAICINQNNPQEKGHQVQHMGSIYKGAEEVLGWLGLEDDASDSLLGLVSWIESKATEATAMEHRDRWTELCYRHMDRWRANNNPGVFLRMNQAFQTLLERPWFTRVWILQEIAHAKTARILCGRSSCPARTFALMPQLLGLEIDSHARAVLDIMPRFRKTTWYSSKPQLHVLTQEICREPGFPASR